MIVAIVTGIGYLIRLDRMDHVAMAEHGSLGQARRA